MTDAAAEPARHQPALAEPPGYFAVSRRPIQILIFLLPLIVAYELAMLLVLQTAGGGTHTITAHKRLLEVFDLFGLSASGWYLPGVLVVVVLLVAQLLSREPWRVSGRALLGMVAEAIVLTIPLVVLGQIVARLTADGAAAAGMVTLGPAAEFAERTLIERISLSVGAGLYEELVFRMAILGVLHALFVDIIRATERFGSAMAIAISALLFAVYHFDLSNLAESFSWPLALFYTASGIFFGAVFLIRGFGIVVAVHAIYDIVTAILIEMAG